MLIHRRQLELAGSGALAVDVGSGSPPAPAAGVRLGTRKPRTPGGRRRGAAGEGANGSTPSSTGLKMRKSRRHGPVGTPSRTEGRRARRPGLEIWQKTDKETPSSQRAGALAQAAPPQARRPSSSRKRSELGDSAYLLTSPCRPSRLIQKYQTREATPTSLERHSPNVGRGSRRAGTQSLQALGTSSQKYSPRNAGRVKMVCHVCVGAHGH